MQECMERGWVLPEEKLARDTLPKRLYRWIDQGAVVIFDGLDEVLVKLDAGAGAEFCATLLSIFDIASKRQQEARQDAKILPKILISTRTQFFRTLREQRNLLTGEERGNKKAEMFQVMTLLPFNDEQVRQYLKAALPEVDIHRIEDMLQSVHNLEGLTKRPYTLRFVSEQIPMLEDAMLAGQTVYGITLYREMTRRWLDRDQAKHLIRPEHKLLLVKHLAAFLWRRRVSALPVGELEDWFHEWIENTPNLRRRYSGLSPDPPKRDYALSISVYLEEDLRNSTFLARVDTTADDGAFRFSHTSLQEYFLANYLYDAVCADKPALWEMPCPSDETLDFFGQFLAEESGKTAVGGPVSLKTLHRWAQSPRTETNHNILRYAARARANGMPAPDLRGIRLGGANLRGTDFTRLDLRSADFEAADLREATLRGCDLRETSLRGANLTRALVLECRLDNAILDLANLTGAVFRKSSICASLENSTLYRTQWLLCDGVSASIAENPQSLFVSANGDPQKAIHPVRKNLRSFHHCGVIHAVAWSPDGKTIASAGDDGCLRFWNVGSGNCFAVDLLPDAQYAVWNEDRTLRFATEDAWPFLGWQARVDGKLTRLPAEMFGPLPLPPSAAATLSVTSAPASDDA
jgi:hypothetical protein